MTEKKDRKEEITDEWTEDKQKNTHQKLISEWRQLMAYLK